MKANQDNKRWLMAVAVIAFGLIVARGSAGAERGRRILDAAGVKGGLVVHLNCGDGKLTAALGADEGFLVHGLDGDPENIARARRHIRSLGLYGKVSVERWDVPYLPYADNIVKLVVAEDLGQVSMDEVMRVLAPGGVAYIRKAGKWTRTVKPRPAQIDEWTHFLYDSTNNAVSNDSLVGPPDQLQWVAGPSWARSHDHLASVSAVVCSAGRIFYIVDEGPIAAVVLRPKWYLVARDAFSGVLLWKRPIAAWQWHLRGFRSGPSDLARRLVAVGGRVYVTLGVTAPVSALDAATGRTIRTYKGTEGTLEILYSEGRLFVVAGDPQRLRALARPKGRPEKPGFAVVHSQRPDYLEIPPTKRLLAIEAETGRVLWTRSDGETRELMPTTLAVKGDRLFFQNPDEIICAESLTGKDIWRAERPTSRSRPAWSAPTLVVYGDVVLSADRAVARNKTMDKSTNRKVEWFVTSRGGQAPVGELIAFSAKDGRRLWSSRARECYNAPVDVLVADGLVWTGDIVKASDPGVTQGLDPLTGEVKRTRPKDQVFFSPGMPHQRCYRNKATCRYLILGRSGVEFIEVATGNAIPNHWVRGTCQYGVIPCNGLLYAPPHSCACFITAKLNGFNCLKPRPTSRDSGRERAKLRQSRRLEKGPAYDKIDGDSAQSDCQNDWPTYRHDCRRSGATNVSVPTDLKLLWQRQLSGQLTAPVVASGTVFVASVNTHTVQAVEAGTGRVVWSYTAGGRIDSPPTISSGRVLFGCADGYLYCLRASDGKLAWRFRAAPQDTRMVAYDQLESLWPVGGSVLVQDGIAFCAAGRSSYLDGGIRLCRVDIETGEMLSETVLDDRDPNTGYQRKDVVRGTNIPGALGDILSSDGSSVYLRHRRFDLQGRELPADVPHLFSPAGFLDASWWHRTYWLLGSTMGTNYGGWPRSGNQAPAGRLLVLGDSAVYGFGRNQYTRLGAHIGIDASTIYHFNPTRDTKLRFTFYQAFALDREQPGRASGASKRSGPGKSLAGKQYRWTRRLPILARAMILAGKTLFLAGPPDIFLSDDPLAALEGKKGGILCAVSAADGKELARFKLDSPPVFDGMAASGGRLYIATTEGMLLCLGAK